MPPDKLFSNFWKNVIICLKIYSFITLYKRIIDDNLILRSNKEFIKYFFIFISWNKVIVKKVQPNHPSSSGSTQGPKKFIFVSNSSLVSAVHFANRGSRYWEWQGNFNISNFELFMMINPAISSLRFNAIVGFKGL